MSYESQCADMRTAGGGNKELFAWRLGFLWLVRAGLARSDITMHLLTFHIPVHFISASISISRLHNRVVKSIPDRILSNCTYDVKWPVSVAPSGCGGFKIVRHRVVFVGRSRCDVRSRCNYCACRQVHCLVRDSQVPCWQAMARVRLIVRRPLVQVVFQGCDMMRSPSYTRQDKRLASKPSWSRSLAPAMCMYGRHCTWPNRRD